MAHKWEFRNRFRRNAFGWRSSSLAVQRVKEAVSEIKKIAKSDPLLAAEGAVIFLEKISPALEQVDSSSGAIGAAVNNAIVSLVPIIQKAPIKAPEREKLLNRLWQAIEEDSMPYIETLGEYWGELCADEDMASVWADEFIGTVRTMWTHERREGGYGYFKGTSACFSSLLFAKRYHEVLELLDLAPVKFWHYRQWGVKALFAMGKKKEALRFAEESHGLNENPIAIAEACEAILLSSGLAEEAYRRYAIQANQKTTYLSTFRAIAKKYPGKKAEMILSDLVASTPGREGKWFAAANSAGLYAQALELARRSPCDPKTLLRASRDRLESEPIFAAEVGFLALHWIVEGYGYEIDGGDVIAAYELSMKAAVNCGMEIEMRDRIKKLVDGVGQNQRFVKNVLGERLG